MKLAMNSIHSTDKFAGNPAGRNPVHYQQNRMKNYSRGSNRHFVHVLFIYFAIIIVASGFLSNATGQTATPVRILAGAPLGDAIDNLVRRLGDIPHRITALPMEVFVQAEIARWTKVVEFSGARPE